jgi:chromosome segregation ATPase
MSEKGSSGVIQVTIALIGVLGSLGVAYITTGAKFKSEVDEARVKITDAQRDVGELKSSAQDLKAKLTSQEAEETRLASQQGAFDERISKLQEQLSAAENKNKEFQDQLAELRTFIDSSKQEVNSTAKDAIKQITAAQIRRNSSLP